MSMTEITKDQKTQKNNRISSEYQDLLPFLWDTDTITVNGQPMVVLFPPEEMRKGKE